MKFREAISERECAADVSGTYASGSCKLKWNSASSDVIILVCSAFNPLPDEKFWDKLNVAQEEVLFRDRTLTTYYRVDGVEYDCRLFYLSSAMVQAQNGGANLTLSGDWIPPVTIQVFLYSGKEVLIPLRKENGFTLKAKFVIEVKRGFLPCIFGKKVTISGKTSPYYSDGCFCYTNDRSLDRYGEKYEYPIPNENIGMRFRLYAKGRISIDACKRYDDLFLISKK